jgi:hypothetical protein
MTFYIEVKKKNYKERKVIKEKREKAEKEKQKRKMERQYILSLYILCYSYCAE